MLARNNLTVYARSIDGISFSPSLLLAATVPLIAAEIDILILSYPFFCSKADFDAFQQIMTFLTSDCKTVLDSV